MYFNWLSRLYVHLMVADWCQGAFSFVVGKRRQIARRKGSIWNATLLCFQVTMLARQCDVAFLSTVTRLFGLSPFATTARKGSCGTKSATLQCHVFIFQKRLTMLRFPVLLLGVFSLGTLAVPLSLPPAGKANKSKSSIFPSIFYTLKLTEQCRCKHLQVKKRFNFSFWIIF